MRNFEKYLAEKEGKLPYKLVLFSHTGDRIRDIGDKTKDDGGILFKSAKAVGVEVFLADFVGSYISEKNGKKYLNSFPFDKDNEVIYPDAKEKASDIKYQKPFELDPQNTLIMPRGLGTLGFTSSRNWADMIKNLEEEGFFTVPSIHCWTVCSSKYRTDLILRRDGLRTPKTVPIVHSEDAERAVEELGTDFPIILKSSTGTQTGVGVIIIESMRSLYSSIQMLLLYSKYMPIIIQEFIKTDYDVRSMVLDGKVLGSMKRKVIQDGDFRSNVSLGAESETIEITDIEKRDVIKTAESVKGQLVGVDFIPAKDREKEQPYILECNSMPGFGGIEELNKETSLTQGIFKHFLDRKHWKRM